MSVCSECVGVQPHFEIDHGCDVNRSTKPRPRNKNHILTTRAKSDTVTHLVSSEWRKQEMSSIIPTSWVSLYHLRNVTEQDFPPIINQNVAVKIANHCFLMNSGSYSLWGTKWVHPLSLVLQCEKQFIVWFMYLLQDKFYYIYHRNLNLQLSEPCMLA
jgi:hypothetical protein